MNGIMCVSMGKEKKAQKGDQHTKSKWIEGKGSDMIQNEIWGFSLMM